MKRILITLFSLFGIASSAHTVDVRLLSVMTVTSVNVSVSYGNYVLFLDGKQQPDSIAQKVFQLTVVNDSLEIRIPGDTLGRFATFLLQNKNDSAAFKIKPVSPLTGTRLYDHTLAISVLNKSLRCINTVDLEHYVAGVVESEAGGNSVKEFYKVQAILCRTYALSQLHRHAADGYDVCDGVHCQAYRSRPTDPKVQQAVDETAGLVLVDSRLILITAAFSSNCGGQTTNCEDVWNVPVPYLKSVKDTFCTGMPNARWQRKIARQDWLQYLQSKYNYPISDSAACSSAMNMTQDTRGSYFVYGSYRIPYKQIRADWQLKSAYFSIEEGKDSITIHGRGYGHGVGLCQEGAIRMAKLGYSYDQILHYYYQDVEIVDLSRLEFFKEE